jgi:hypothetical protein
VILCVVCGFTAAYAALTNVFYNREANVYEIKLILKETLQISVLQKY